MLEWLAHVDAADAPPELVAIAYELPDDEAVTRMGMSELPTGWRASPAPEDLRRIGIEWLDAGETVALVVPSVVLPLGDEQNVVLNPAHSGMARLTEVYRERVTVDPRLTRK
jgi:RES domain-containing protein